MAKKTVLFVCSGNTARSLMAEAILRQRAGDRFEVLSAGLNPGEARRETLEVLREAGYDVEGLYSKPIQQYLEHVFIHYLVTVCAQAEEHCPRIWPIGGERIFWSVDDPAIVEGVGRLNAFRDARDDLARRIETWLDSHAE